MPAPFALRGGSASLERLDELRAVLDNESIERVISNGLHEFVDWIQVMLGEVGADLGEDFFGYSRADESQEQKAQ